MIIGIVVFRFERTLVLSRRWFIRAKRRSGPHGRDKGKTMRIARGQSGAIRRERRACHRCGWTADVEMVSRRGNRSLGISTAFRWLCDDCCDDLGVHRAKANKTDVTPKERKVEGDRRIVA